MTDTDIEEQISERNAIRREAKLPLLDEREAARLRLVVENAAFETYWQTVRDGYAHLWSDRTRGILTNSGSYSACRVRAKKAFGADRRPQEGADCAPEKQILRGEP